jgi:integrase
VLTDAELRTVWNAAGKMGHPYGPVIKLLMLTGQRDLEIAGMSWAEIDDPEEPRLLTIHGQRMKGGVTHAVPLTQTAVDLLKDLPRWTGGECVSSTTRGVKPIKASQRQKNAWTR